MCDRSYRIVETQHAPSFIGIQCTIVMFHCGTETHWRADYSAGAIAMLTLWHQVEPVVETRTVWREKR